MHNVRSHQRLARMTGREVPSAEVLLDQLTTREATIARRGLARVGYPGAQVGNNNSPNVVPTCAFCPSFSLIVLTCSMPSEKTSGVGTTQLAAEVAGEGFSPVGVAALLNNTLTPANTPSTPNSLGLDIVTNDVGYVATVQMGTPPRDFNILMDSGSADLWVGAEKCVSEVGSDCVRLSIPQLLYTRLTSRLGVGESQVSWD